MANLDPPLENLKAPANDAPPEEIPVDNGN